MAEIKQQTAELADVRPPAGEYFYRDAYCIYSSHMFVSHYACFACGEKATSPSGYWHLKATAQCMASGWRISTMFKPESCYGPDPIHGGGACVIVSACGAHKHHAEILHRLTADGIITLDRVSRAEKASISRQEFNEHVAKRAFGIWNDREPYRKLNNWCEAWELFLKKIGRIPSPAERAELAERLHEARKNAQAMEDWLTAEKEVSILYTVAE